MAGTEARRPWLMPCRIGLGSPQLCRCRTKQGRPLAGSWLARQRCQEFLRCNTPRPGQPQGPPGPGHRPAMAAAMRDGPGTRQRCTARRGSFSLPTGTFPSQRIPDAALPGDRPASAPTCSFQIAQGGWIRPYGTTGGDDQVSWVQAVAEQQNRMRSAVLH